MIVNPLIGIWLKF